MGWGETRNSHSGPMGGASGSCRLPCTHDKPCGQAGLRCHRNFPSFADLPSDSEFNLDYYTECSGGRLRPRRHWCLVGEVERVVFAVRWRVLVKTRFGERVMVHFHLDLEHEESKNPQFFAWSELKKGATLCILYAEEHNFLDMSRGIRQECDAGVMVFSASQDVLAAELDAVTAAVIAPDECVVCHQMCAARKCGECKVAQYCGTTCQLRHWSASHKSLCGHAVMLANLCRSDFSTFEEFFDWTFRPRLSLPPSLPLARVGDPLSEMRQLLCAIADKVLGYDSTIAPILNTFPRLKMDHIPGFRVKVQELFLYRSLMELCDLVRSDPRKRTHVVDMCGGLDDHRNQECLVHALSLALPQWQRDEGIQGGIAWSMEAHTHARMFFRAMYECDTNTKEIWGTNHSGSREIEIYSINHRTCGITATWSDDTRVVAGVGIAAGDKLKGSSIIVRVLRVTGNQSRKAAIRELALMETPSNVYTVWIREDLSPCGKFSKSLNAEHSLVQQLLDSHPLNILEAVYETCEWERHDRPEQGVVRTGKPRVNNISVTCCACGQCDGATTLTKNQQNTFLATRKCAFCTAKT